MNPFSYFHSKRFQLTLHFLEHRICNSCADLLNFNLLLWATLDNGQ